MRDGDIKDELATIADEAEAHRDDAPQIRLRSRRPPRDPSQVYSIRIPVDRLEDLRRIAEERDVAPTVLMRKWVLERLETEQVSGGPPVRGLVDVVEIQWNEASTAATTLAARLYARHERIEGLY